MYFIEIAYALLADFWKRRKCVICIDYSFFVSDTSYTGYIVSVTKFLKIANIFKRIFDKFLLAGFKSLLGMIWGMSYGGQLMIHTGKRLNIENNTLIQVGHCKTLSYSICGVIGMHEIL